MTLEHSELANGTRLDTAAPTVASDLRGSSSAAQIGTPALQMTDIGKTYPGVVALEDVEFTLGRGEVRALLGKNGAGKSTLVRIISGVERPDNGRIRLDGREVSPRTPGEARGLGIATVFQELSVIPDLSVAENISLGRWPLRRGVIDRRRLRDRARASLGRLGRRLDLDTRMGTLSVADQQVVEIARALSQDARILLLDEPTSSLPQHEVETLIRLVRSVAQQGVAVVYITHRLDEVTRVADSVTVLRDGHLIATQAMADTSMGTMVSQMVGGASAMATERPDERPVSGAPLLGVEGLRLAPRLHDVTFSLRGGEVLGIAGLLGSGRTELLRVLAGAVRPEAGTITMDGKAVLVTSVRQMLGLGVALAPEDRRHEGIVPHLSVYENLAAGSWWCRSPAGRIDRRGIKRDAAQSVSSLAIKTPSLSTPIANLSGGNQQKVVIGRWLGRGVRVLLLDEPTRGIDVEAKAQIYRIIRDLAAGGMSIIVVSSELEELLFCCDTIHVLRSGRSAGDHRASALTAERLTQLAIAEF
jgi:ABC-type sugar transport system ATPase subunit